MTIAALNALVLTLTEEKGTLEFQRTVIDARRQILTQRSAELSAQLQDKYLEEMKDWKDDEEANTSVMKFNMQEFQVEFDAAQARIDAEDQMLQMERTNNDTKLEAISTSLENVQKQLTKNEESEMKGMQ